VSSVVFRVVNIMLSCRWLPTFRRNARPTSRLNSPLGRDHNFLQNVCNLLQDHTALQTFRHQSTWRWPLHPNDGDSKLLWNVGQYLPDSQLNLKIVVFYFKMQRGEEKKFQWDFRFSMWWVWRWLSSGLPYRVVSQKFTDVLEMLSASIIRTISTHHNSPESCHLHNRSRENMKSHNYNLYVRKLQTKTSEF
jgi:hypothetical protein